MRLVRPVQVLEDEHRLPLLRPALEQPPPGRERLLLRRGLTPRADQREQARLEPGEVGIVRRQGLLELRLHLLGEVGLEDPALGLDDLAERPEGDPLPVGKAAALTPADESGPLLDVREELGAEAALADSRLADDCHELAGALLRGALEGADQERLLELAADERGRVRAGDVSSEPRASRERAVEGERLRLALDHHGVELLVLEDALGRSIGRLRDGDAVDGCGALQAGGGVDDVPGDDPLTFLRTCPEGDDRLARVDADAHLERERRVLLVQLLDRLEDAKPRADGPLGVVLVRDRRAEHRHHGVADELLDRPSVQLDLVPELSVVRADAGANVLRVSCLRGGREADEVAEEDSHDLAFFLHRRRGLFGQWGRAERAEGEFARQLLAAGRTCRHAGSL